MASPAPPRSLLYGQFIHGLSRGLLTLALAGVFWFNMAAFSADCVRAGVPFGSGESVQLHYVLWEPWVALLCAAGICYCAIRVRRKAPGFRFSALRNAGPIHRALTRRIVRTFLFVSLAEGALCGMTAFLGTHFHHENLIWPGIGLAVSLHFIPLAIVFRVPPYHFAGAAGAVISLAALLTNQKDLIITGILMGLTLWGTAVYILTRVDRLALGWTGLPDERP